MPAKKEPMSPIKFESKSAIKKIEPNSPQNKVLDTPVRNQIASPLRIEK